MRKNNRQELFDDHHRDDMYYLLKDGVEIKVRLPKNGHYDRPHVFVDGRGEIVPASKTRSQRSVFGISGKTFKLGPPHSHDDFHQFHILEDMAHIPRDLITRFRRLSKNCRQKKS